MPPPQNPAGVKSCSRCGLEKPLSEFNMKRDAYRPECRGCQKEDGKKYRVAKKVADPDYGKRKHYQLRFKLSLEAVEEIFASVDFRCESCGDHRDDTYNKSLVLDHDHACCPGEYTCGKCIRGVLCTKCNMAFGFLNDSVQRAEQLADYARSRVNATSPATISSVGSGTSE